MGVCSIISCIFFVEIKYAKPKRGKTAQGVWKDIVNVNDYTQTLRMEKCMKPGGSCSYVSHHYKSQCSQGKRYSPNFEMTVLPGAAELGVL